MPLRHKRCSWKAGRGSKRCARRSRSIKAALRRAKTSLTKSMQSHSYKNGSAVCQKARSVMAKRRSSLRRLYGKYGPRYSNFKRVGAINGSAVRISRVCRNY